MIFAATVVDTPGDPFAGDPADALAEDGALLVRDGVIRGRGSLAALRDAHPGEPVTRLDGGLLVPGFVDTHVHFPQIRAIGGLGLPLLDWLEQYALPEESKLADQAYARAVAAEFLDGLVAAGTTSALVFGSHFAPAMDELFGAAERRGLNIISGLVLSDRILRRDLLNSPQTALTDSADLILRWHDRGRLRYAVTPRFSLSVSDEMLDVCAELLGKGVWFTSHINENLAEIATVAGLFPGARHYLDTYDRHGLVTARSVFAHDVHPGDAELALLAEHGRVGRALRDQQLRAGQRAVPAAPARRARSSRVALGSDVGAGAGLFLPKEALQAYFIQQLLGAAGLRLTAVHLLYLATRAGARALGLDHRVGDFTVGKDFDAVWLRPAPGSTLAVNLRHARDTTDALARIFTLATPADVAGVWVQGEPAVPQSGAEPVPRRGRPLADQRHALDGVMRAPAAHPVAVEKHEGHPRLRPPDLRS